MELLRSLRGRRLFFASAVMFVLAGAGVVHYSILSRRLARELSPPTITQCTVYPAQNMACRISITKPRANGYNAYLFFPDNSTCKDHGLDVPAVLSHLRLRARSPNGGQVLATFPVVDSKFEDTPSHHGWADNRLAVWRFEPPSGLESLYIECEILPGIQWPDRLLFAVGDSMMEKGWGIDRSLARDVQWLELRLVLALLAGGILALALCVWKERRRGGS